MAHVLVVDDVEDQRDLLAELFRRAGCSVSVTDGTGGVAESLAEHAPDLVVIDLMLRGEDDGWKAIDRVRALAPTAAIVISSVLDVAEFPAADGYLPKPFTGAQVRALVGTLLTGAR